MSFSVRKTRFRFSFTRVKTSPNSGVRWWMIGSAPAADTSGGIGVGPGDIKRYLFIMGKKVPLVPRATVCILDIIVRDGYILGQVVYKLLLSRRQESFMLGRYPSNSLNIAPASTIVLNGWLR